MMIINIIYYGIDNYMIRVLIIIIINQGIEKTDDEYQVDDAYLKRATAQQSEAAMEEKDRSNAISGLYLLPILTSQILPPF